MRSRFWVKLSIVLVGYLAIYIAVGYAPKFDLIINRTESLPQTLFFSRPVSRDIHKGDYIYFTRSECPVPVLKKVAGVSGDIIEVVDGRVFISGEDRGPISSRLFPIKSQVIPKGSLFLWGSHKESYDSRYADFGLVSIDKIEGIAWPIF